MRFRKHNENMQMRVMRRLWWDKTLTGAEIGALWGITQVMVAYYLGSSASSSDPTADCSIRAGWAAAARRGFISPAPCLRQAEFPRKPTP